MSKSGMRLADLAAELGRDVDGNSEVWIEGVAPLDSAGPADLSFVRSKQFASSLLSTEAGAVIAPEDLDAGGRPTIRSPNPGLDFSRAARCLVPESRPREGVHPTANVAPDASIDATATVGPGCVIGARSAIGPGSVLMPNTTLYEG